MWSLIGSWLLEWKNEVVNKSTLWSFLILCLLGCETFFIHLLTICTGFSSLMEWEKVRMGGGWGVGWGWVGATWAMQSEALKIWCLHWFQKQEKNNQKRTKVKQQYVNEHIDQRDESGDLKFPHTNFWRGGSYITPFFFLFKKKHLYDFILYTFPKPKDDPKF